MKSLLIRLGLTATAVGFYLVTQSTTPVFAEEYNCSAARQKLEAKKIDLIWSSSMSYLNRDVEQSAMRTAKDIEDLRKEYRENGCEEVKDNSSNKENSNLEFPEK